MKRAFYMAATFVVAAILIFPFYLHAEEFWHDQLSREDWQATKNREGWIKEQAAACIRERQRVSSAHGRAVAYLDQRDRTLAGGYVGSGIIMREEKRIQRIFYQAADTIQAINYSLGARENPAAECKGAADAAIKEIRTIIQRYP
jgi:hypothetical protein